MSLTYLSTLRFDTDWLAGLHAVVPDLEVQQITTSDAGDIPADLWRRVDVLHTASALPDPGWAPRLKLVQLDTSGVEHVAGTALWASTVPIANLAGLAGVPMAEYVLMCVLALAHRVPALRASRTAHEWPDHAERVRRFTPAPLPGSTMAVVGYGRIGREVARLATAHGMKVLGVRRRPPGSATGPAPLADPLAGGAEVEVFGLDRLHEVLSLADHVVVLLPSTTATRGCLDATAIAAMRPGATVVNASRGGIVDSAALLDAVHSGRLAGAALDVFDVEPLPAGDPLWDDPQVLLTPHVAGLAPGYANGVAELLGENLRRLVAGRPLVNLVDRASGY